MSIRAHTRSRATEPAELTPLAQRRLQFLIIGCYAVITVTTVFLVLYNLRQSSLTPILLDCGTILVAAYIRIALWRGATSTWYAHALIFTIILSQFLSFLSPAANIAIYFPPVITIGTYFLLGRRDATIWSGITAAGLVVLGLTKYNFAQSHLSPSGAYLTAQAVAIGSLLLYSYEGINITNERTINEQNHQIMAANTQLAEELAKRAHADGELKQVLADTKKRNDQLNQTKLAMTNILEDAHDLQLQLQDEKAAVEQKVEERTLEFQEERARLQASIDSLESGFLMTFRTGQTVSYNPALLKIFGLDRLSDPGSHNESLDAIEVLQQLLGRVFDLSGAIAKCQKTGQPFRAPEVEFNGKTLSIFGAAIRHGAGGIIGSVVLIDDITEAKALERSKEEFVAIASHELRTPLTAIRGNASLLTQLYGDQIKDHDMRTMILDIGDASERLIGVVNEFLNISQLEQGKVSLNNAEFDLYAVTSKIVTDLTEMAKAKHLTLKLQGSSAPQLVANDLARTQEVIINLIGNAIKYTETGGVTVEVVRTKQDSEVLVHDTGQGIKPEHQRLLFHKFQQATGDILTRMSSRSTGLDLYISKLLVEKMGGRIGLRQSVPGKGSTFFFSLPIAPQRGYSEHNNNVASKKAKPKE